MSIITIDGPSGSGKSTVSREVARRLGYTYLDTGAMYRAVGWLTIQENIDPTDTDQLAPLLATMELAMAPGPEDVLVHVNGQDVSRAIRTADMGMVASRVSAMPLVRQKLVEMQRQIGRKGRIVAEGRDMGTVVFPQAPHKFFLNASAEERARRRTLQLRERGEEVEQEEILQQLMARDEADSSRALSPLKPAADTIIIDSSQMDAAQVVNFIMDHLAKK